MAAQIAKTKGARKKSAKPITNRKAAMVAARLSGATLQEIADQHGCVPSTVHRVLSDEQLQDILRRGTADVIALVPKAIQNIDRLQGSDKEEVSHKASETILRTAGLAATHASPLVQQYIQINQTNVISPGLQSLLGRMLPVADVIEEEDAEEIVAPG